MESIIKDVEWLGAKYDGEVRFESNYFQEMYEAAIKLIKKGKAYVCDLSAEQIREYRGTLKEPGKESPYRNRSIEENLALFEGMKNGEFPHGSKVLRAKIDMASPNMNMRDPVLYRVARDVYKRQSLVRALDIISQEEGAPAFAREVYGEMLSDIKKGVSLSDAMENRNCFPGLMRGMIRSGEGSGNLDEVTARLAVHYEKEAILNQQVRSAMMYPLVLLVMCVVIVLIIVTFVLPQFEELFSQMESLSLIHILYFYGGSGCRL